MSPARLAALAVAVLLVGLVAWYIDATNRALDQLGVETRADCAFKRDVAGLWRVATTRSRTVLQLSSDGRYAYIHKGCVSQLGPAPYVPPVPK